MAEPTEITSEVERRQIARALGLQNTGATHSELVYRAQELTSSLTRHRETERRHRDQRAGLCELLGTHWDKAEEALRALIAQRDELQRANAEMAAEMVGAVTPERLAAAVGDLPLTTAEERDARMVAEIREAISIRLAGVLEALCAVIATSSLDWSRSPDLAWIYAVLVGWHPDKLDDVQERFGWRDSAIDAIEAQRRALLDVGVTE